MLRGVGLVIIFILSILSTNRRRSGKFSIFHAFDAFDGPEGRFSEITTANSNYFFHENPKDILWFSFHPDEIHRMRMIPNHSLRKLSKMARLYPKYHFVWYDTRQHSDHAFEVLGCKKFPCVTHTAPNSDNVSVRHFSAINEASVHSFIHALHEGRATEYTPLEPSKWARNRQDMVTRMSRVKQRALDFNEVDPYFEAVRIWNNMGFGCE